MRRHVKQVNLAGKIVDKSWKLKNPNELVFDSNFERQFYLKLESLGVNFIFHPPSRELVPSFKVPAISRGKEVKLILSTVRSINYTPDFLIYCKDGTHIYIETKGFFEDAARLRYKLFQKSLKSNEQCFIIYSMREANKFFTLLVEEYHKIQKFSKTNNI